MLSVVKKIIGNGYLVSIMIASCTSITDPVENPEEIYNQYLKAIQDINIVSYKVNKIDTFATGTVWNNTGAAVLKKDPNDKILGFQIYGAQMDVPNEMIYDGSRLFLINNSKRNYELFDRHPGAILGTPGGQMAVQEFIVRDTIQPGITISKNHYILRYDYPDNEDLGITGRHKIIYLDKSTFLPNRVEKRSINMGEKSVTIWLIDSVRVNDQSLESHFDLSYLAEYDLIQRAYIDQHKPLLNTKVPSFEFKSFDGASFNLEAKSGKVILLDFWEIWCGPCILSMPKLQSLQDDYGNRRFEVIGIITNKATVDKAKSILEKKSVTYLNVIGSKEINDYFKVTGIPQYVIIDRDGLITFISQGYSDKIEEEIKKLL